MSAISDFLNDPFLIEKIITLAFTTFPMIEWDIYNNDGYLTNSFLSEFNLVKDNPNEIEFISWPPQVVSRYDDINYDAIATSSFYKEIKEFINILINNFPKENLKMFYNNINELKINSNSISYNRKIQSLKNLLLCMRHDDYTAATYNSAKNKIKLSKNDIKPLPHELFHMASSYNDYEKGIIFSGFKQQETRHGRCIGRGVNEGYTECMVLNYFGDDYISYSRCYSLLRNIMEEIQNIIGKETIESLYLTADLDELVKEIAKYDNYDNARDFVSAMDFLYHCSNSKFVKSKKNKKLYVNNLEFIHKLLLRMNIKKIKGKYENGDFSKEELVKELQNSFIPIITIYLNNESFESEIEFDDYNKMAEEAIKEITNNY